MCRSSNIGTNKSTNISIRLCEKNRIEGEEEEGLESFLGVPPLMRERERRSNPPHVKSCCERALGQRGVIHSTTGHIVSVWSIERGMEKIGEEEGGKKNNNKVNIRIRTYINGGKGRKNEISL